MPNGGQIGSGSGLRLQSSTPGAVDTGNANLSGKLIVGAFSTENADSTVPGSNLILGDDYTDGVDGGQQVTVCGNSTKNGLVAGDFTPSFTTIAGFNASASSDGAVVVGNSASAGISRGNVGQSNPHIAIGRNSSARGDAADYAAFSNVAIGASASAIGRRCYSYGPGVQGNGTGQSDLLFIGSNIGVTGNNLLNCLVIRSAATTKNLTAAADSNSIQIGEPTQTRVLLGPYTITNGIAAVGALQTAGVTIANTAVETTGIGALVGSNLIPAGRLTAGSTIRIRARGIMADTGAPTLRIRVKVGANTYCDTGAVALAAIAGTHGWIFEADVTVRTAGGAGTAIGNSNFQVSLHLPPDLDTINTATTALDTTIANTVDVTFQWGTADPANTLTVTHYTMEILG